jgi:hypothetical protein
MPPLASGQSEPGTERREPDTPEPHASGRSRRAILEACEPIANRGLGIAAITADSHRPQQTNRRSAPNSL